MNRAKELRAELQAKREELSFLSAEMEKLKVRIAESESPFEVGDIIISPDKVKARVSRFDNYGAWCHYFKKDGTLGKAERRVYYSGAWEKVDD